MFFCAMISSSLGSRSSASGVAAAAAAVVAPSGGGDAMAEAGPGAAGMPYMGVCAALDGSPLRSVSQPSRSKLPPSSFVKSAFGQS